MAYVYRHIRCDTNEVFYIGIGKRKNYARAFEVESRNPIWTNIINKTQYVIDIICDDVSWNEACVIERKLISFYGRRDLSSGTLVNLTSGGDGVPEPSQLIKEKISNSLRGHKQSDETKEKRRKTLKQTWKNPELRALKSKQTRELNLLGRTGTKGKPSKKKGTKLPDYIKKKLSESHKKFLESHDVWNKKHFDDQIKNDIYQNYCNGIAIIELSRKLNVSRNVIYRIIKEKGNEYENYEDRISGNCTDQAI